jgi:SAM-dependent methyltransferase
VLDWGCGNGHFSYALLRLGYKAHGFELGDFRLRKYLSEDYQFHQANPRDPNILPYPNNEFDAVVSVGVLEHGRVDTGGTEEVSLRQIYRVLKPGGYFICYHFPNRFSWIEAITSIILRKHHHSYRYTKRSIQELCWRTGYELQEMQRYGALPRNSWNSVPQRIRYSPMVANAWNAIDHVMSYPFSPLCQNYLFVAKKPPTLFR